MATYDLSQGMPASISEGDILYCPYAANITTPFELPLSDGIYTILCKGAKGGDGTPGGSDIVYGGSGGCVKGTLQLTGSHTLYLYPGSAGVTNQSTVVGGGGWNGGGDASPAIGTQYGYPFAGGGGGAADVRLDGTSLSDRILVAGGGGGASGWSGSKGGSGGGINGADGDGIYMPAMDHRGFGGTQSAGGSYGGALGYGGTNPNIPTTYRSPGGGGGGGYYGGGAANPNRPPCANGAGGGSGYADSSLLTSISLDAAEPIFASEYNGYVYITIDSLSPTPPTPTQFPFRVKVNGAWKNVDHGYVCVNGVFKPIKKVFYKTGGVWKNA